MRIRLDGIYRDSSEFRQKVEPPSDPSIVLVDHDQIKSGNRAELIAIEPNPEGWELTPAVTRRLDLVAHIDDKTGMPPTDRPLGVTPVVLRWVIEGDDPNGYPTARFFDQPVHIRVASQTELEFLWLWIVFFLGVVVLFAILWFIFHAHRGGGSSQAPQSLLSMEDDLNMHRKPEPEIDEDRPPQSPPAVREAEQETKKPKDGSEVSDPPFGAENPEG